ENDSPEIDQTHPVRYGKAGLLIFAPGLLFVYQLTQVDRALNETELPENPNNKILGLLCRGAVGALWKKSLRGVKALRPERRGNLQVVRRRYVEIATSACGGLAMTRYGGFSTSPRSAR
ncbi:MAG: hypothetical protein KAT58_02370, partial [candidate division Zixibacteria bacterium]|nr:hypothetical protein [candidate division Zixibacteria bacterium]